MKSCTCETCKAMCERPCWPTPKEAEKLIEAGFGNRLMEDYWAGNSGNVSILCPALVGSEGHAAPSWARGKCTFQDKNGLCELHDLGLKPIEGRLADCQNEDATKNLHEMVMVAWNNQGAVNLVHRWNETF